MNAGQTKINVKGLKDISEINLKKTEDRRPIFSAPMQPWRHPHHTSYDLAHNILI